MNDPFNLQRFVDAQQPLFDQALAELRNGHKTGHWMWFVFPQLQGLGRSSAAVFFGLSGAAEARAYLAHETLGPRLEQAVQALLAHRDKSALQILGHPDDLKCRSCLTLFAHIAPERGLFRQGLERFYAGQADELTLVLLSERWPPRTGI